VCGAKSETTEMSGACVTETRNAREVLMGKTEGIAFKL
jgi:hypothetical protein